MENNRVCTDLGVMSDVNAAKNLCSGADIDMAADPGDAISLRSDCHLLKNEAVDTDFGIRVNNDPVRVRDAETATDITI